MREVQDQGGLYGRNTRKMGNIVGEIEERWWEIVWRYTGQGFLGFGDNCTPKFKLGLISNCL